jgi:sugar lactone lactonase YvrE
MNAKAELFVDSRCELGEGPFWHPLVKRLFWFDIVNQTLLSADTDGHLVDRFTFKDTVSAAGVIDEDRLLVAQSGSLIEFSLSRDSGREVVPLEADKPGNRTNDGRVNPSGGFWIGTMSRKGGQEQGAGSVYQYRGGEVTKVIDNITIPNSTCFSADGRTAYFTDSGKMIKKCAIDPDTGLPVGEWQDHASLPDDSEADGSVLDAEGYLWNARWRGNCVVRFAPDGTVDRVIDVPASRVTCPAFGGDDLKTLYLTSARQGMSPEELAVEPHAGSVFSIRVDVPGMPESLVKL